MSILCPQAEGASITNIADAKTIVNGLRAEVICILLLARGSLECVTG
jgi:hypothetical protein